MSSGNSRQAQEAYLVVRRLAYAALPQLQPLPPWLGAMGLYWLTMVVQRNDNLK